VRLALLVLLTSAALPAAADDAPPAPSHADDRPRVYLDCHTNCFPDYLKGEITFVDYVRDRTDADVHILVSRQETGSGGREYTLALAGHGRFVNLNDTVLYDAVQDEPEDKVRAGLAQGLKLGLMRYVLKTQMRPHITVSSSEPPTSARKTRDPWKSWVFSTRLEGELEGEESRHEHTARLAVSANRVTEEWKTFLSLSARHKQETFDVDGEQVVSTRVDREAEGYVVRSLGPHWSAGASAAAWRSSFDNVARGLRVGPALEWSVYPYDQYARRRLVARYTLELRGLDYVEETLYGRTSETRGRHEIELRLDRRAEWGAVEGQVELSQYLHDVSKYRVEVSAETALRLVQGLSLNVDARVSRVHDRLSLPLRGATPEEVLLKQRQVATGYEYRTWVGITYSFGSIFNNVVNPRFD
jgi:hypothetical protein